MNQQQLINLATKLGLLMKVEDFPKTLPAHQRLLSKLEKFYEDAFNAGYNEGHWDDNK